MGSSITNWDGVEGAIFMGAGGGMPAVWVWIAIAACVVPLIIGAIADRKKR